MNRHEIGSIILKAIAEPMGAVCSQNDFDNCPDDQVGRCFCILQCNSVLKAIESAGLVIVPKDGEVRIEEFEKYKRALQDIAEQHTTYTLYSDTNNVCADLDFEGAYDEMIYRARATLKQVGTKP